MLSDRCFGRSWRGWAKLARQRDKGERARGGQQQPGQAGLMLVLSKVVQQPPARKPPPPPKASPSLLAPI
ncbi:hypothetical protein JOS77_18970 [Chromobacterium haemolyticum]|nr:hypothetical protein JOS77_18970 [Chromobacterium haemolyticum]